MFLEYSELTSKVSAFIFWYIYFVKSFFELQKPSTYVCMCIYIYHISIYDRFLRIRLLFIALTLKVAKSSLTPPLCVLPSKKTNPYPTKPEVRNIIELKSELVGGYHI